MNSGNKLWFRKKDAYRFGEGHARICHMNQDLPARNRIFSGNNRSGGAIFGRREIIVVFGERQVARFGVFGGGKSSQRGVWVADNLAGDNFGDFSSGK